MNTAMILAAGRGTRLKPFTDKIPKSLCVVHGKPLIEHHIIRLVKAGFTRLVINHAYLGGQLRHFLGNGRRWNAEIIYSPEPIGGLETGGGIRNALSLLGQQSFITVNADIFTDYDFCKLSLPADSLAHLVLTKADPLLHPKADFGLTKNHRVQNHQPNLIFSGIAYYRTEVFQNLMPGRFSVAPLLRALAEENKISGEEYTGRWFDIGSAERLALANLA